MLVRNGPTIFRDGQHVADQTLAAMQDMERYCATHPGSPAAVRRPRLSLRSGLWIALLGPSVGEGIVGIGASVETALRAFDRQHMVGLRPPNAGSALALDAEMKRGAFPSVESLSAKA